MPFPVYGFRMAPKKTMTPRERILGVLRGEPVDRVPIWLLFPWHTTSYYTDVRTNPRYASVFEASRNYAVHLDRRNIALTRFAPEVERHVETWTDGSKRMRRGSLSYKGRTLTEETGVRRLLEDERDLELFCGLPVNLDETAIGRELSAQMPAYERERAEFPTDLGSMMLDLGEPIGLLYESSSLLEYPIWSLTHSDLIESFLGRLQRHYLIEYRWMLERDAADVYFLVGSELASPPLVSRATFQRWIVPFVRELIELIHSYGKLVIQHYHGQIREILPDFLEMKPDGLHTIEAPPVGNCPLANAFDVVGDRIALIGNIQYDDFRSFTRSRMREAVRGVLAEAAGRRLVLSPTAGPYEDWISDDMIGNYLTFLETGWEAGVLPAGRAT